MTLTGNLILGANNPRGLVLGTELISTGGFDSDTGWTVDGGAAIADGVATFTNAGITALYYTITGLSTVVGTQYEIRFDVLSVSAGSLGVRLASTGLPLFSISAAGSYKCIGAVGAAAPDNKNIVFDGTAFSGVIDNVSVKQYEAIDKHLFQICNRLGVLQDKGVL